jgi:hypothetical protein
MMYQAKITRNNVAVAGKGLVMDVPSPAELRSEIRLTEKRRISGI